MPNWCENHLHLESNNLDKVTQIYDYVIEHKKLFSLVDPLPEDYDNKNLTEQQLIEMHGHKDWYDWQIAHWGTKWDIDFYNIDIDKTPDYISLNISFGTAWSPAGESVLIKLLEFLEDDSATMDNLFYEPGMNFIGESRLYYTDTKEVFSFTSDYTIPSYDCFSNKSFLQLCLDEGITRDMLDIFNLEEGIFEYCSQEVLE
jgi:hypothetical protein